MKYIITEYQRYTLLMETLSPKFRRRLTFDNMVEEMKSIIEYQLEPCSFGNVSVFVAEACDMFVYSFFEDHEDATPKERDAVYYYAVDVFEPYLVKQYNKNCRGKDGLNESQDNLIRKAKILKTYVEEVLSEKPWFNGLNIRVTSYQTSQVVPNQRPKLVSIPMFMFDIDTKGLPKSISSNDVIKLDDEVIDIVDTLFTSIFPSDEYDNPQAVWDTKFDLHL
jgi:hypothetical protein